MAIKVKVTLLDANDGGKEKNLGTICIANDGSGTPEIGNYNILFENRDVPKQSLLSQIWQPSF